MIKVEKLKNKSVEVNCQDMLSEKLREMDETV